MSDSDVEIVSASRTGKRAAAPATRAPRPVGARARASVSAAVASLASPPARTRSRASTSRTASKISLDDDDDDDDQPVTSAAAKKKRSAAENRAASAALARAAASSTPVSQPSSDESAGPSKAKGKAKVAKKGSRQKSRLNRTVLSDDDDGELPSRTANDENVPGRLASTTPEEMPTSPRPSAKAKGKQRRSFSLSEDEDDAAPARRASRATQKMSTPRSTSKAIALDSDSSCDAPPRATARTSSRKAELQAQKRRHETPSDESDELASKDSDDDSDDSNSSDSDEGSIDSQAEQLMDTTQHAVPRKRKRQRVTDSAGRKVRQADMADEVYVAKRKVNNMTSFVAQLAAIKKKAKYGKQKGKNKKARLDSDQDSDSDESLGAARKRKGKGKAIDISSGSEEDGVIAVSGKKRRAVSLTPPPDLSDDAIAEAKERARRAAGFDQMYQPVLPDEVEDLELEAMLVEAQLRQAKVPSAPLSPATEGKSVPIRVVPMRTLDAAFATTQAPIDKLATEDKPFKVLIPAGKPVADVFEAVSIRWKCPMSDIVATYNDQRVYTSTSLRTLDIYDSATFQVFPLDVYEEYVTEKERHAIAAKFGQDEEEPAEDGGSPSKDAQGTHTASDGADDSGAQLFLINVRAKGERQHAFAVKPTWTFRQVLRHFVKVEKISKDKLPQLSLEYEGEKLDLQQQLGESEVEPEDFVEVHGE